MKTLLKRCALLLLLALPALAQSYDALVVRDPQNPWRNGQATIEEAVIAMKPKGIYTEVGLYLTFSARGLNFSNSDTLEVQLNFDLPRNAIVHDSWLWIENEIIKGKILDKWTAEAIYEEIVSRRRDPSILYKREQGKYELRIFPMAGDESRTVKITCLLPATWGADQVLSALPTNILRTTKNPLAKTSVLTWISDEWQNPQIAELPELTFQSYSDTTFGDYYRVDLSTDKFDETLHLALDAPLKDGLYVSKYGNDAGLYQMVLLPSHALDISDKRKVAILFDYDISKSTVVQADILKQVKNYLHSDFMASDSFNLFFSKVNIQRASQKWIPADSASIEATFASLGDNPIANYSNMPALLADGVDFIRNHGNDANILLIASTDQVGNFQVANQLIEDLLDLMDPVFPIHVADLQNRQFNYYQAGGRTYWGNEYFYSNLTRMTGGNLNQIRLGASFPTLISAAFQSISGYIKTFDLHTTLQNGFCYGRLNVDSNFQSVYLNKPLMQVGKFSGSFPFVIDVSGIYNSTIFSEKIEWSPEQTMPADSLTAKMWAGNYIKALETQQQTNDVITEIIEYSINERVLSIYSAFICLEPGRGGEVCYDCIDESVLVSVEEYESEAESDSLLQAYPNPFNLQTTIEFRVSPALKGAELKFEIYNILGQVIRRFEPQLDAQRNRYTFVWNGQNDSGIEVSSGSYFFIVTAPHKRFSTKLLLMK